MTSDDTPADRSDRQADLDDRVADMHAALTDSRQEIASMLVEALVVNHLLGIWELAAIHLTTNPPRLDQAALAIDALACVVEGLGPRLGPEFATLNEALSNIRLAFVQVKAAHQAG